MWIQLKNREPFVLPGLWDCWRDRDDGGELYTFTIITTRPNALLKPIHDRMPVIYDGEMGRQWLRGPFGNGRMDLDLVLQPIPSGQMEAYEVSTLVNSPEDDRAECTERVNCSPIQSQQRLF